jgi:hypothetical protein
MEKLAQALNKMLERKDLISNVIGKGKEYYFLFNKKHKWSVVFNASPIKYSLYYYTLDISLEDIANITSFNDSMYVFFSDEKLKDLNCLEQVKQLYIYLEGSAAGLDEALDEILSI